VDGVEKIVAAFLAIILAPYNLAGNLLTSSRLPILTGILKPELLMITLEELL
jgi:hypothetical protein